MAIRLRLSISGDETVKRALAELRPPARDRWLSTGLRGGGKRVVRRARRAYLSGQMLAVRSGDLKRSLDLDASRLPGRLDVISKHPGAGALHWGWPAKNIGEHRFLERSIDDETPGISEELAKALDSRWVQAGAR